MDLLPNIIVGASAGSIMASCLCTLKRDEVDMMSKFDFMFGRQMVSFREDSILQNIQIAANGSPLGYVDQLKCFIRDLTRDLTFLEIYENNGWILNINVTDMNKRPRLLNYLTAPNVVVWSAAVCSCALPEFYGP